MVVVLKARQSWVKLKSWLILSSTTPKGYYFHPFPDDRAEGAKYRFSGFTPNKQTNKQTNKLPVLGLGLHEVQDHGISSHFYLLNLLRRSMALLEPPEPPQEVIFLRAPVWGDDNLL